LLKDPDGEDVDVHTYRLMIGSQMYLTSSRPDIMFAEVKELKRHLQIVPNDEDDVYTEATPLSRKVPIVDYEIYNENNKPYYKIKGADDNMANENVPAPAPTRSDDQILPFAAWDTLMFEAKTGAYRFLLDEDWFRLDANLLREALEITPVGQDHQFVSPPSGYAILDFVNQLGYPGEIHFVSRMAECTLLAYVEMVATHKQGIAAVKEGGKKKTTPKADKPMKPAPAKQAKPANAKQPKPKPSSLQLVDEPDEEQDQPEPEPQGAGEEYDLERAIQMKATRPLPMVEGKGKTIAIEEQAAQSLLALHTPKRRISFGKNSSESAVYSAKSAAYLLCFPEKPRFNDKNGFAMIRILKVKSFIKFVTENFENTRQARHTFSEEGPEYQDTHDSGKKETKGFTFYRMEMEEASERYKDGEKVVKKEFLVALKGELYFVKFIINPEEDDVEPEVVLRRSFLRLNKGIIDFGNGIITIYPDIVFFNDDSDDD
nr:hypothetical protein [Tanacetum cinerariifolium]